MPKINNIHAGTGVLAEIKPFTGATAPTNFMICDGTAISRTTYATLFALISTTYGVGDGSTTFNLPDMRGIFLKGAGTQTISGIVHAGTLGTKENDQSQDFQIGFSAGYYGGLEPAGSAYSSSANGSYAVAQFNTSGQQSGAGKLTSVSDGANGTPRKGTTTKPANVSVNYIIRVL
jgi:microcystin-dependent protein